MEGVLSYLTLLFDRPSEPVFTPKGTEGIVFQLPEQLLPQRYAKFATAILERFRSSTKRLIPLKVMEKLPTFPIASKLPLDEGFSHYLPKHQEMATEVIDILMNVPENQPERFLVTCIYARSKLNPQLFNYCFSVVLMHRKDTRNVRIQNYAKTFPSMFLVSEVFMKAREFAAVIPESLTRPPILVLRPTATDLDIEHRVAYWREDIGINLHYWHWHLVNPITSSDRSVVAKDRRGELFYYMNQQIIARYNCERLNNALMRVEPFSNWRNPIPEGYFSKLCDLTTMREWPPRKADMIWRDVKRPENYVDITIEDMELWTLNIEEAIATGMPNGSTMKLDIDTLGNMVEASMLSPNRKLYGNLHDNGHILTAYIHDPENRYLEQYSVMANRATTMRDPFFYRLHAWFDELFQKHKQSLHVSPYTKSELEEPSIQVTSATIENTGGEQNTLTTFWMISEVNISIGLDFCKRGPIRVRFTHLNHRPFRYVINVNNTDVARRATVRIFLAPKFDERNLPWLFIDQRKMFIEMDRFVTLLNSGRNEIIRESTESSVTIPFDQTFGRGWKEGQDPSTFNYCGCGWPQHVLVPKGTEAGAPYQLFVMLSDYEKDKVDQPEDKEITLKEASSFCGLMNKKYPDRRSMGFPFDRPFTSPSPFYIKDFIQPNMALTDITIRLQDVTEANPNNLQE